MRQSRRRESVRRAFFGAEPEAIERLEESVFESILQTRRLLHTHSERIFLVGCGEGAAVAYWLGMSFPERFAGVVAINGWLPVGLRPLCQVEGMPQSGGAGRAWRLEHEGAAGGCPAKRGHTSGGWLASCVSVIPERTPLSNRDALGRRHLAHGPLHGEPELLSERGPSREAATEGPGRAGCRKQRFRRRALQSASGAVYSGTSGPRAGSGAHSTDGGGDPRGWMGRLPVLNAARMWRWAVSLPAGRFAAASAIGCSKFPTFRAPRARRGSAVDTCARNGSPGRGRSLVSWWLWS